MASDRFGIVVGLAAEARIARRFGHPVAIGGGTTRGAADAARRLVADGVTGLISFGLAGGLDPRLRPGAILVPQFVLADGERFETDAGLSRRLGGAVEGGLLGARSVVTDAAEKRRLWQATGAAAIDLESGAVARIAAEHRLPFAALRAICDASHRTLPPAALVALDARGGIGLYRVLASLAAAPRQLPALLALAADAACARRALVLRVRQIAPARQPFGVCR